MSWEPKDKEAILSSKSRFAIPLLLTEVKEDALYTVAGRASPRIIDDSSLELSNSMLQQSPELLASKPSDKELSPRHLTDSVLPLSRLSVNRSNHVPVSELMIESPGDSSQGTESFSPPSSAVALPRQVVAGSLAELRDETIQDEAILEGTRFASVRELAQVDDGDDVLIGTFQRSGTVKSDDSAPLKVPIESTIDRYRANGDDMALPALGKVSSLSPIHEEESSKQIMNWILGNRDSLQNKSSVSTGSLVWVTGRALVEEVELGKALEVTLNSLHFLNGFDRGVREVTFDSP